jgi:hypothetical protein
MEELEYLNQNPGVHYLKMPSRITFYDVKGRQAMLKC